MPNGRRATLALMLFAAHILAACGSEPAATTPPSTATIGTVSQTPTPQPGSFLAFCPAIHVRFLAPPHVMQDSTSCEAKSYFLATNIADSTVVEFLSVFRYAGDARGASAEGWQNILDAFRAIDATSGDTAWSAVATPTPQIVQGHPGFVGQFARTDKGGVRYSGTLWAGAVGEDTIVILDQGSPQRQVILDADFAQVLRTMEMDAQ
jgi:hypothetical protein